MYLTRITIGCSTCPSHHVCDVPGYTWKKRITIGSGTCPSYRVTNSVRGGRKCTAKSQPPPQAPLNCRRRGKGFFHRGKKFSTILHGVLHYYKVKYYQTSYFTTACTNSYVHDCPRPRVNCFLCRTQQISDSQLESNSKQHRMPTWLLSNMVAFASVLTQLALPKESCHAVCHAV